MDMTPGARRRAGLARSCPPRRAESFQELPTGWSGGGGGGGSSNASLRPLALLSTLSGFQRPWPFQEPLSREEGKRHSLLEQKNVHFSPRDEVTREAPPSRLSVRPNEMRRGKEGFVNNLGEEEEVFLVISVYWVSVTCRQVFKSSLSKRIFRAPMAILIFIYLLHEYPTFPPGLSIKHFFQFYVQEDNSPVWTKRESPSEFP